MGRGSHLLLPLLGVGLACGEADAPEGRRVRTEVDDFGLFTCSGESGARTCLSQRGVAGISMGAGVAAQLIFARPELFDAGMILGAPTVDLTFLLRNLRRGYLGGFCERAQILAHLDNLADPATPAFCGPVAGQERFEPTGAITEPNQDFNHWWIGQEAGRGGPFGRDRFREAFHDLVLAYGNPTLYNPESPFLPPQVPASDLGLPAEERCLSPRVLTGIYDARYNPDGTLPVIVPCDTATITSGDFDPAHPSDRPIDFALAVDFNGNGRRDYAEPVLVQTSEPHEDVGLGPSDTFDWQLHPEGRGGNGLYDEGEPYQDVGLDGVPGTQDYGEGNGRFDLNPNAEVWLQEGPRGLLAAAPEAQLTRLHLYADAGIRDFLLSAGATNWLWAALKQRLGPERVRTIDRLEQLPGSAPGRYDFLTVDLSLGAVGQDLYVRYGDPAADARTLAQGDGNHVGPVDQLLNRMLTGFRFFDGRFIELDRRAVPNSGETQLRTERYYSEALGEERVFGVALPPGYDDPANAELRYPVVYFVHGLGMTYETLLLLCQLFINYMTESNQEATARLGQADLGKFIIVVPDLHCHRGECQAASFNANLRGLDGQGPRFQDAFFEMMVAAESRFRVRPPIELDADDPARPR